MNESTSNLKARIDEALSKHSASFSPWSCPMPEFPGMWVVSAGDDGRPDMLEYKNYMITRIPPRQGEDRGWRAVYNDYGDYPFIKQVDIDDQFREPTLEAIYARLLKLYETLEPITTEADFDTWMSTYLGNKYRHDNQLSGKNSPQSVIRANYEDGSRRVKQQRVEDGDQGASRVDQV